MKRRRNQYRMPFGVVLICAIITWFIFNVANLFAAQLDEISTESDLTLTTIEEVLDLPETIVYIPASEIEIPDQILPQNISKLSEFNEAAAMLAQTIYGEANGLSLYERSMVAWCICNRVDSGFGSTIQEVIKAPGQFHGYSANKPVTDENYKLAIDVMMRWSYEKYSLGEVGRTLPKEYLYFYGKNGHNWFRTKDGTIYDNSSVNPY